MVQSSRFKVGDTVRFKSGGPRLVVSKVSGKKVSVMWWTHEGFQTETGMMDDYFDFVKDDDPYY